MTDICLLSLSMRRFGLRSINRIDNITGIVGYSVGFVVDSAGGIGLSAPRKYETLLPTQERFVVSIPKKNLKDGDTIVIWFKVSDISGNSDDVRLSVGLDRTAPNVTDDNFRKKTVDDFTSRSVNFFPSNYTLCQVYSYLDVLGQLIVCMSRW